MKIIYFIKKVDINDNVFGVDVGNVVTDKMFCSEIGEFIYKFTLNYGKNQTMDYVAKIIVE